MTRLIAVFLLVFGLVIAGVAISRIDREDPADGAAQQLAEQESTLSLLALPLLAGLCLSAGVVLFGIGMGRWSNPRAHSEPGRRRGRSRGARQDETRLVVQATNSGVAEAVMRKTGMLGRMAVVAIALLTQVALSAGQFSSTQAYDLPSLERRVADARAKLTSAASASTTVSNPGELTQLETELDAIEDEVTYLRVKTRRGESVSENDRREIRIA